MLTGLDKIVHWVAIVLNCVWDKDTVVGKCMVVTKCRGTWMMLYKVIYVCLPWPVFHMVHAHLVRLGLIGWLRVRVEVCVRLRSLFLCVVDCTSVSRWNVGHLGNAQHKEWIEVVQRTSVWKCHDRKNKMFLGKTNIIVKLFLSKREDPSYGRHMFKLELRVKSNKFMVGSTDR